jgi:hypothetical protein
VLVQSVKLIDQLLVVVQAQKLLHLLNLLYLGLLCSYLLLHLFHYTFISGYLLLQLSFSPLLLLIPMHYCRLQVRGPRIALIEGLVQALLKFQKKC